MGTMKNTSTIFNPSRRASVAPFLVPSHAVSALPITRMSARIEARKVVMTGNKVDTKPDWYSKVYLRSEHWINLRNQAIADAAGKCRLCGSVSVFNDVHHINYKGGVFQVEKSNLRVLCRVCHEKVHALIDKYSGLKSIDPDKAWRIVKSHLCAGSKQRRIDGLNRRVKRVAAQKLKKLYDKIYPIYVLARRDVLEKKDFYGRYRKRDCPWHDSIIPWYCGFESPPEIEQWIEKFDENIKLLGQPSCVLFPPDLVGKKHSIHLVDGAGI